MKSIWTAGFEEGLLPQRDAVPGNLRTDVLVIGGGIAGLLCAHKLQEAGVKCVVLDAGRIGCGTTANTTAKITSQHRLVYAGLIRKQGLEVARQYYHINEEALAAFQQMAERIPCDLESQIAYVYSLKNKRKLEEEAEAYLTLGIPSVFRNEPPLPFNSFGALGMRNQAQFHPMKFLAGIAKNLTVYENTLVLDVQGNAAVTAEGVVTAEHIVLATHFPLVNFPGGYFLKLHQSRSYVLALAGAQDVGGMYIDENPAGLSFRNYGKYLLVGGEGKRTGKKSAGAAGLRAFAEKAYPGAKERYAWAAQDCISLDDLPYIGTHQKGTSNLFVATGFNKWGMTGAMASAMVICDLILHGRSDFSALFSPQRSVLTPRLFSHLASAVAGMASFGKRCTHMGCGLRWNGDEESWDCSCHGSRFARNGHVLENPAKRGLYGE